MLNYQKMYTHLFNEISEALDDLTRQNYGIAKDRLMRAQLHAEEIYIDDGQENRISPAGE